MVAIIKAGKSINRILSYNENKVNAKVAECISAANYPIDHDKMGYAMKLNRLLKQIELHDKPEVNSIHISLNFDVSESHLSKQKLVEIADAYMGKIGFGKQPYLVYQHHDAGHPHIHIVTTNIEGKGKRISTHHQGRLTSEPARKEIEEQFGLVKAEDHKKQDIFDMKPIAAKANYGKAETKKAIQNILANVVDHYYYTSIHELNAVLKVYNVTAERGSEKSRVFQHGGLLYRILDEDGKPIGVPIKASSFFNKPTLNTLQQKFEPNEGKRDPHRRRITNAIDLALRDEKTTLPQLMDTLKQSGIHVVLRQNEKGIIYGLTYVDHVSRGVFNGSKLGKKYSAKAIQERCGEQPFAAKKDKGSKVSKTEKFQPKTLQVPFKSNNSTSLLSDLLKDLLNEEPVHDQIPYELSGKRRKRRKKRPNTDQ